LKLLSQWAASFNYCLISLFIIAYFFCSAAWRWLTAPGGLGPSGAVPTRLKHWLTPITTLSGLEQCWAFFSPNIDSENSYTLIVVTLQNGLLKLVELPRLEKLNLLQKFEKEKYRKLFNDNMPKSAYASIRPDIARFYSRANSEPHNKPLRAAFFLISTPIPPPDLPATDKPAAISGQHMPVEKYFVYGVSPDDF
jgi:hypothetical protein